MTSIEHARHLMDEVNECIDATNDKIAEATRAGLIVEIALREIPSFAKRLTTQWIEAEVKISPDKIKLR